MFERSLSPLRPQNSAGSAEPALVPVMLFSFSNDIPSTLGWWKVYFYKRPKDNEVKRSRGRKAVRHEHILGQNTVNGRAGCNAYSLLL
jgi:hypothetical protein